MLTESVAVFPRALVGNFMLYGVAIENVMKDTIQITHNTTSGV